MESYYAKYGKSLGTFDTPDNATAYAKALHEQQALLGASGGRTTLPPMIHPTAPPVAPGLNTNLRMGISSPYPLQGLFAPKIK
jgi:hypothetical protein